MYEGFMESMVTFYYIYHYFYLIIIQFLGKPSRPEGPLEVSNVTKTGCKVQWKKPSDDGGSPIREYEVEKLDLATGKWTRVGKVPGDKEELNITGLEPGSEYKFRVTAVNDEGDSEPLITDKSIIAKNPFGKYKQYYIY